MKNSILVLAFLFAVPNLSAVKRQVTTSVAEELAAAKQAQATLARQTRIEYGNNASEQNKAEQPAPKPARKNKAAQQPNAAAPAPKNEAPEAEQKNEAKAENSTSAQDAPVDKEPVVQAQSTGYTARLLKVGAAVGTVGTMGGLALMACKAYIAANPTVYPILVHNGIMGATWCFANCI